MLPASVSVPPTALVPASSPDGSTGYVPAPTPSYSGGITWLGLGDSNGSNPSPSYTSGSVGNGGVGYSGALFWSPSYGGSYGGTDKAASERNKDNDDDR